MNSRATPVDNQLAETIRRLRDEAGLTQSQVARAIGVTYQSYQKMERAGSHSFRVSMLCRLAEIFRVKPADLLSGDAVALSGPREDAHRLIDEIAEAQLGRAVSELVRIKHGEA